MKQVSLIEKALQSEKAYKQMTGGIYTFVVSKSAKKKQIKKLIENQFSVKVKRVNMAKFAPKIKRIAKSRKTTAVGGGKKAIVYLREGQEIAMFMPKSTEKNKKKQQKGAKEKEIEQVSAEGKEV